MVKKSPHFYVIEILFSCLFSSVLMREGNFTATKEKAHRKPSRKLRAKQLMQNIERTEERERERYIESERQRTREEKRDGGRRCFTTASNAVLKKK